MRAIACGVSVGLLSAGAIAAPAGHGAVAARAKASRGGKKGAQSIGAPNNGHLTGAVRLRGSRSLHQREGAHSWGLPQLVHLLHRAASTVGRKHRGSQMLVGDLSGRTGGHLDHHSSHQTGRDADVGFYVMNSKGKPIAAKRFIPFDDAGNARDAPGVRFDEARNWTMIEAMLKDDKATVHYMFITNALRGKLLAYAAKKHAPKEIIDRAAAVMMSPADADLHDDHVHVRISCPESMRDACIEESTAREVPSKVSSHDGGDEKPADPIDPPPNPRATMGAPLANSRAASIDSGADGKAP